MSSDKRRKIARLRALAASTTFPPEAASARAKADALEAKLGGPEKPKPTIDPNDYLNDLRAYYYGTAAQQAQTNAQQSWGHATLTPETLDELLRTMAFRQW